jgi:histidine triad (HIT) family protein
MAFLDVFPIREGHSLLIPKKHFVNMLDVDPEVVAHLAKRLIDLTRGVKGATKADVLNVVANGSGAGQEVPHLHFHAIPRSSGDEFRFTFPPGYRETMAKREDLNAMAKRIGESL